jgi:hypothetical protein
MVEQHRRFGEVMDHLVQILHLVVLLQLAAVPATMHLFPRRADLAAAEDI